jgi:hypothetical protein
MKRLLLLLAVTAATLASAEVYRWVDEAGVTVYSQTPPEHGEADRINPQAAPAREAERAKSELESIRKGVDDHLGARKEAGEARREQEERARVRRANCETARANLASLEAAAGRLVRLPDGSYARLEEEDRQQRMDEARRVVADECD